MAGRALSPPIWCFVSLRAAITALRERLAFRRSDIIAKPTAALAQYKKIIDLASAQAKIGVWECDLATTTLSWTEGVYDLFELPANARVTRTQAVTFYDPESRAQMENLRAKAIRDRTGFTLDARIITAKGNMRWMRLTANVECKNGVAVRLFGMKQDITTERDLLDQLRRLAETDLLTGLANRGVLQARLEAVAPSALLLIDLDEFKQINDTFGHSAGDDCLKEVAARLTCLCAQDSLIARLGGDEFAVVVEPGMERRDIDRLVVALIETMRRPIRWNGRWFAMSASIGVVIPDPAMLPDAASLLHEADLALYAAKADGRNTARLFTPDLRVKADRRLTTTREPIDGQFDLFGQAVGAAGDLRAA
jgi:diguanylate cyclase (GGDEF)-like protein